MHVLLRIVWGGANEVMCDVPDKAEELKCTHFNHTASWREVAPLIIQRKQLNVFYELLVLWAHLPHYCPLTLPLEGSKSSEFPGFTMVAQTALRALLLLPP